MTILGLWMAIAGYAVLYAGLANWQGSGMSIPDAFTGKGVVKCPGAATAAASAESPPGPGGVPRWSEKGAYATGGSGGSGLGLRWV